MSLPFKGWPGACLSDLVELVRGFASHGEIYNFKIGRTNDTTVRHRDYSARYTPAPTHLIAIYETDSVNHALDIEAALIGRFIKHAKCLNEADHAGGGVSPSYRQYVYVAVWMAA